jgi:asparagine synthase (glutamine-hydrolysing)
MCGFAGVYEYGTAEGRVSPEQIARMRDTLAHRGPDDAGLFVSDDMRVGLGHRRLAIVDIAGGAQPMFGKSGECLVYNGEIYNYPHLRKQLEGEGVAFRTNCDTEVVLRLYERHGAAGLGRLDGMFAFALWEPARQRLLLARDPAGEKPLYFSDACGRLVFGSEIKALLVHPSIPRKLNDAALDAYLTHLVTPPPDTLFRGIFKLAQGEMAVCDRNGLSVSRYRDAGFARRFSPEGLGHAASRVRSLLESSTRACLMSDVPVGLLLSGGLDSTALLALLGERARGLPTFSVGFAEAPAFDEREKARRVARHFGTDHHEVSVSPQQAVAVLPELIHHQDEPLADLVCVPLHFVCSLAAAAGVKVVLGGEGSDELFWGYPRYQKIVRSWPWIAMLRRLPRPLRSALATAIPARRLPRLRDFAEGLTADRVPPMHMPVGVTQAQRSKLLRSGGAGPRWVAASHGAGEPGGLDTLALDTQEYEFGVRLPERLLMRIDRFSMASGVEARLPYLGRELVEYVYQLPPRLKIAGAQTKIVLRKAVGDLVPSWVLARSKQGFEAPVAAWFEARMGELLDALAQEDALRSYFDPAGLDALKDARRAPGATAALWPVLNFALWHLAWIEGRDLRELLEGI